MTHLPEAFSTVVDPLAGLTPATAPGAFVAAWTDVGPQRERNEDAVLVAGLILGGADRGRWAGPVEPSPTSVVAVFDGMGGHGAGSVAAVLAAAMLNEHAATRAGGGGHDQAWLETALQACADTVTDVGSLRPETRIMGAVVAGLLLGRHTVLAFNVGDARVYVYEGGYLSQLTTDHRSSSSGRLTRSLGGTGVREAVAPDVVDMDRRVTRRYLLCSDGLSDTLDFDVLRDLVAAESATTAAEALVAAAVSAGSHDNVTVAVVDVGAA